MGDVERPARTLNSQSPTPKEPPTANARRSQGAGWDWRHCSVGSWALGVPWELEIGRWQLSLSLSQHLRRIDARRSARGKPAGEQADRGEDDRGAGDRRRVARLQLVEQGPHQR